jgi:hypothetical protein
MVRSAWLAVAAVVFALATAGAEPPNTLTLDNQSGEDALVKVVGPGGSTVTVPTSTSRTVHVAAGEHALLVRYGREPGPFSYSKGDPFAVEQTATQYSIITITLHKVVNGNYRTEAIPAEEFERAAR